MRYAELKKSILDGLAPYVKEHGFKTVKKDFSIVRKEKDKKFEITFFKTNGLGTIELRPEMWCNFHKILEISDKYRTANGSYLLYNCVQMNLFAFRDLVEGKITTSDRIKFFSPNPKCFIVKDGFFYQHIQDWENYPKVTRRRFTPLFIVREPEDVTNVVEFLKSLLSYAFRYFEWIGSIEALDRIYNEMPIHENVNLLWITGQATAGIIAARISGNPNYEEIKKSYLDIINDNEINEILRRIAAEVESRYPETTPDSTTA